VPEPREVADIKRVLNDRYAVAGEAARCDVVGSSLRVCEEPMTGLRHATLDEPLEPSRRLDEALAVTPQRDPWTMPLPQEEQVGPQGAGALERGGGGRPPRQARTDAGKSGGARQSRPIARARHGRSLVRAHRLRQPGPEFLPPHRGE